MTVSKDDIAAIQAAWQALSPAAPQISEAIRQMKRGLGPALETLHEWSAAVAPFLEELNRTAEAAAEATERIQPFLEEFGEWTRTTDASLEAGWLPHHSARYSLVEECGDDLFLLDSRLADDYRSRWIEIRDDMNSRLADYHIDDEARATFREALLAHEAGLYRCTCRVLFPEIERMIGAGRVGSKKMLEKLIGSRDPADLTSRERYDWVLFDRLVLHAYEQVSEDERGRFERDPTPNRHAAVHGLVAYSTHKHSMNMLILTDYVFRILPPIEDPHT